MSSSHMAPLPLNTLVTSLAPEVASPNMDRDLQQIYKHHHQITSS
jgi:hypothetical protein